MKHAKIILKKGRDKNIRARHPWVFSGAIDRIEPTQTPECGETVAVCAANGDVLGIGAWSPKSQIQVRMWSVGKADINAAFFSQQIQQAYEQRMALGIPHANTAYRLINAESDGLPGVIVDVFGDYLVMQLLTCGADYWRDTLVKALAEHIPNQGIYERSDVDVRKKEGLPPVTGLLHGEMPPSPMLINEQGRQYYVDVFKGHKTGFYLDQRDNRQLLQQYADGKSVLNCFSYTGGFAMAALKAGAVKVTNIDASQPALDLAQQAASENGFDDQQMENICTDVFQQLRQYRDQGKQFDIVVLDPPKFAENRKQINKAARGYKDINLLGFKLLKPGGLLFTFSCSGLLEASLFQKIVADAAVDAGCNAKIIHKLEQATDHPTRLAFPEGFYLKGLVCQK